MKVAVLGEYDLCCLLLQHHGVNILLDCCAAPELARTEQGLSSQTQAAAVQKGEATSSTAGSSAVHIRVPQYSSCFRSKELHAVLITSPYALLGLPHLQQVLQHQGKKLPLHVYCTEPVYHAFQHVATELLQTQQLLQQQVSMDQQQYQQTAADQLQLFQQQVKLHEEQLLAQQQQQYAPYAVPQNLQQQGISPASHTVAAQQHYNQQQPVWPNPAAAGLGPPVPPPMPPPLPARVAAAAAGQPVMAPHGPPAWQQATGPVQFALAQPAGAPPAAAVVRGPIPPPVPPPLGAVIRLGPAGLRTGVAAPPPSSAAALAGAVRPPVPPPAPPPLPLSPAAAAAAVGNIRPPIPPPAPPAVPSSAVEAAGRGGGVGPAVPPSKPPAGAPSPNSALPHTAVAAAAAAGGGAARPPTPPPVPPFGAAPPVATAAGSIRPPAPPPGSPPPGQGLQAVFTAAATPTVAAGASAAADQPVAAGAAVAADHFPVMQSKESSSSQQHTTAAALKAAESELVPLFTPQQLQSVLQCLQIVRYGERVVLPGCWGLTAEARPSGNSSIGTAIWLMSTGSQRIAYLSSASLYPNHSVSLHKPSLQNLHALILGPGSLCPDVSVLNPVEGFLRLAAAAAAHAVRAGGRVLVPVLPTGGVLQLLEHIPAALQDILGPAGSRVPMFYLSPAAPDALATANSCCEYLDTRRREVVLSSGQAPFGHEGLVTSGRLRVLNGTAAGSKGQQQQQWSSEVAEVAAAGPCVAFVSFWSMAAGPGALLATVWCSSPNNLLLLTEQGPLTASWLQGCIQLGQRQQQQHWQVRYYPINSTAGAAIRSPAAAVNLTRACPAREQPPPAGGRKIAGCCRTAVEGCLTAQQLIQLLRLQETAPGGSSSSSVQQLLLGASDSALLHQAGRELRVQLDGCKVTTLVSTMAPPPAMSGAATGSSSSFSFQVIDLPEALLQILISKEVAKSLLLTPLKPVDRDHLASAAAGDPDHILVARQQAAPASHVIVRSHKDPVDQVTDQMSLARVRGLLQYQSGVWRLEPLPGGTKPDAVAAAVDEQQQQCERLVWGTVDVGTLMGDLQAAGYESLYFSSESITLDDGSQVAATLIKLPQVDAEIRLSASESEVVCDDWNVRQQLTAVIMQQLHLL